MKLNYLLAALLFTATGAVFAQNAVMVNGKGIPSKAVDFILKQQAQEQPSQGNAEQKAAQRKELIGRLVDMEVLAQDAATKGIAKSDIETELGLLRMQLMARAALKHFADNNKVSEAEIKAEYDKQNKANPAAGKEYNARHILVETEAEAAGIIAKMKAGAKIETLVSVSKDPGSAAQGGSLGWAGAAVFVKPFSDAMAALKKGEFTQTPVKSDFGFHVIYLEDIRDAQPPSLAELAPQLRESIQNQKLETYQKGLRAKAVVK